MIDWFIFMEHFILHHRLIHAFLIGLFGLLGACLLIRFLAGSWYVFDQMKGYEIPSLMRDKTISPTSFLRERLPSQKKSKLLCQLPFFCRAFGQTLQAGFSLEAGLDFVIEETELPLKLNLIRLRDRLSLSLDPLGPWQDFAEEIDQEEIYFLTESLIYQYERGGNFVPLFKRVGALIEEKQKLARDLKSFTAQGRLSGWLLVGLWPLSFLFFFIFSPHHIQILQSTLIGQLIIGVSLFLEVVGFFWIYKILRFKL